MGNPDQRGISRSRHTTPVKPVLREAPPSRVLVTCIDSWTLGCGQARRRLLGCPRWGAINCSTSVSQFVRCHERATTRPVLRPAVVTAAHPARRYVEARAPFGEPVGDLLSAEAPVQIAIRKEPREETSVRFPRAEGCGDSSDEVILGVRCAAWLRRRSALKSLLRSR